MVLIVFRQLIASSPLIRPFSVLDIFNYPLFTSIRHLSCLNTMENPRDIIHRRVIASPKCPSAIGPYSPAIAANQTLYISGQLGIDPTKGDLVTGGVEKEAEQALINMGSILHAAKADYINVVKTTVLLADIADFQAVNQVYAKFFTHDPPARAAYQVAALPKQARVEIEAIAVLGEILNE